MDLELVEIIFNNKKNTNCLDIEIALKFNVHYVNHLRHKTKFFFVTVWKIVRIKEKQD